MRVLPRTVYSVCQRTHHTPLALGLLTGFAKVANGRALGRHYRFAPGFYSNAKALLCDLERRGPGVLLFSHYMWNTDELLAIGRRVKEAMPECISIHGGPSVPKYESACAAYMRDHQHVDIAVRGEGEGAFAEVLDRLVTIESGEDWDEALGSVRGITFRSGGRGAIVRTPERDRMKDLSVLPSPFLDGCFDRDSWSMAVIETNRGCPYGCTFCDWGSAILQKIHLFPLERVKEEIDWVGRRGVPGIYVADANFGIFDRDVEIAEHAIRTKERYGFPRELVFSFAKSSSERVAEIAKRLIRARLIDAGRISVQSTDPETLSAIRRSNIKTSKYLDLRRVYASERLPIATELIIALPRQTVESFKNDLQFCFDQQTYVSLMRCIVLPNSPMADPEYMRRYAIEVDGGCQVVSTSTLSRIDVERLEWLWQYYYALVDHSVLKYVLYFLQRDHGHRVVDVLDRLVLDAHRGDVGLDETRKVVRLLTNTNINAGGPDPRLSLYRWDRFYHEINGYLAAAYGLAGDSALAAVLRAQRAVMPTLLEQVPRRVFLSHDVAAYVRRTHDGGATVGESAAPLASYPPASLEVTDPLRLRWAVLLSLGRMPLGHHRAYFELRSALSADISRPHFFSIPEIRSVAEAARFSRTLLSLSTKRLRRLVDSHQNLNRSIQDSLRALLKPAIG